MPCAYFTERTGFDQTQAGKQCTKEKNTAEACMESDKCERASVCLQFDECVEN